jgi:hypothetical protein
LINGQIAAEGTTSVTFRLTDTATGLFTDRAINIVGTSALYAFTSFTFTNAGASGRYGPSLSELQDPSTGYGTSGATTWVGNSNYLNVTTQGIQEWTVPKTGLYAFEMVGASGGGSTTYAAHGGYAAYINFNYTLTKGEIIVIVVGQTGINGGSGQEGASGGGGTFVWKKTSGSAITGGATLIAAAGGGGGLGGGNGFTGTNFNPNAVSNDSLPTDGSGNMTAASGGQGGKRSGWPANYGAGAGAGWLGNGEIPSTGTAVSGDPNLTNGYHATEISLSRGGGFSGGRGNWNGAGPNVKYGGFGGGGGGTANSGAGGGGGGYSGGYGGGTPSSQIPGSGGSSYCIVTPTATGLQGPPSKYNGQVRVIPPS